VLTRVDEARSDEDTTHKQTNSECSSMECNDIARARAIAGHPIVSDSERAKNERSE
jgi:hypothetical protein